jgi:hypothetical protein
LFMACSARRHICKSSSIFSRQASSVSIPYRLVISPISRLEPRGTNNGKPSVDLGAEWPKRIPLDRDGMKNSGAGYRYQASLFSGVPIPSEAKPISPQGALRHIGCQAGSRVSTSVNRANSNAREPMPSSRLKSASPLRGILCSIPENTSQECATEKYFKDVLAAVFFQECAASLPCGSISCL